MNKMTPERLLEHAENVKLEILRDEMIYRPPPFWSWYFVPPKEIWIDDDTGGILK